VGNPEKILLVCVENADRSQITEVFLRKFASHFDVISAGTKPESQLIPNVVYAINEIRIDITQQKPKELTNEMIMQSTTINTGCVDNESCHALFVDEVIDWNIPDPKCKYIEELKKIGDQIKNEMLHQIKKLER